MRRFDAGLGAIGVLALFIVLTILLSASLPTIKSDASVKLSDWLGFSGNVITAILAGAAAVVAWVSAQRQIRHIAQQNSVIAYGTLRNVLASINDDAIRTFGMRVELGIIEEAARRIRRNNEIGATELHVELLGITTAVRALREAKQQLEVGRANPWGSASDRKLRNSAINSVNDYVALTNVSLLLLNDVDDNEKSNGPGIAKDIQSELFERANKTLGEFRVAIEAEMERIYRLIDQHFAGFEADIRGYQ